MFFAAHRFFSGSLFTVQCYFCFLNDFCRVAAFYLKWLQRCPQIIFFFAFSHNDVGAVRIKRCCFYSCLVRACCENVSCLRGRMAKMSGHGAWGVGSGPFSEPYLEIIVHYDMTSFLSCFA